MKKVRSFFSYIPFRLLNEKFNPKINKTTKCFSELPLLASRAPAYNIHPFLQLFTKPPSYSGKPCAMKDLNSRLELVYVTFTLRKSVLVENHKLYWLVENRK